MADRTSTRVTAFGLACIVAASIVVTTAIAEPAIEMQIGSGGAQDDYVCWGPTEVRIRLVQPQPQSQTARISSTKHDPTTGSGEVVFVDAPAGGLPSTEFQPQQEITVDLPSDGSWKAFYVAGKTASTEDKDVAIVVKETQGAELGRYPIMVRVRKNAETLTDRERDRFLEAFVNAASRNNQYAKYWGVHTDGENLAHEQAFMPWHRVFLINFERELQAEDPSVALPYWAFDKPAPKLFSEAFIGWVDTGNAGPNGNVVQFGIANPLSRWTQDLRIAPLRRLRNGNASVSPSINKGFIQSNEYSRCCAGFGSRVWGSYHGAAHMHVGGHIGDIGRSPADPLFFLLHANVDRGWAAWQRLHDRFNKSQAVAYAPQGHFQAGSANRFGNFVDDTMWPWDNIVRDTDPIEFTVDPVVLPNNPGPGEGISGQPKVGEALDYLDVAGTRDAQNFCYDDIPYGTGPVPGFFP